MTPTTPCEKACTVVDRINREVIELWKAEFVGREAETRCPLVYPDLATEGLLLIGCNPALPKRGHYAPPMLSTILAEPDAIERLKEQEKQVRRDYPFFQPCERIAGVLGLNWAHVDLFFQRGTSQTDLRKAVCGSLPRRDRPVELSGFAEKQVALAMELVDACKPRIVLVANAFASIIIRARLNLGSLDENGLLWAMIAERRVPVFLSGMLTGQHALDYGSLERLIWHMQKSISNSTGRTQPRPIGLAKGEFTVPDDFNAPLPEDVLKMTPLEAFEALQAHLNLDEAKAKAWMDTVRDARR
jgi:hypothetical protein